MEQAIIPTRLASALHDYLLTRPMGEVEGLVVGLRQAKPFDPAPPEAKKPTPKTEKTDGA